MNLNRMKKLLILLLALNAFNAKAQNSERPFAIGIVGGLTQYNGDLGQGFYDFSQAAYGHYGLSANWFVSPRWDFVVNATNGHMGYVQDKGFRFRTMQLQANAHFRLNLRTSDNHKMIPFLHAGIGLSDVHGFTSSPGTDMYVPFGFGLRYIVNQRVSVLIQETFGYTDHDTHDFAVKRTNDAFLLHSVGILFNLGKVKDSDGDGVSDRHDACPGTKPGVAVDEKGCPLDRDGDGVADAVDKCPDVKGTAATMGCPDRDGDGIADADDACPDVKGIAALKGCPDSDGDGITDADDACPNEAGVAALKGCPDKDGDGVADSEDKCPNEAGPASNGGCPMKAVDPVAPTTGAPAPTVVQQSVLPIIYFASGKATIPHSYYPAMERVVKALKDDTTLKLNIVGNTDNAGKEDPNQHLSINRANTVKAYLIKKGITADRLTTDGKSSTVPAADNKTKIGRSQNRRVEFFSK
jgi:outer membrane protein OmpA-like peptidoglycan-associated protein